MNGVAVTGCLAGVFSVMSDDSGGFSSRQQTYTMDTAWSVGLLAYVERAASWQLPVQMLYLDVHGRGMQIGVSERADHCHIPRERFTALPWSQCEAVRSLAVKSCKTDRLLSYWNAS